MNQDQTPPTSASCVYDLSLPTLQATLGSLGEPSYRAKQIWEWLYVHLVDSFDQMTNLSLSLREKLSAEIGFGNPEELDTLVSSNGQTKKVLLRMASGKEVEAVLMRYRHRRTACISTQAGCPVGCVFCATGQAGFQRNLTAGEIASQALHFARSLQAKGESLTNVVLMGMGEPLLNYDASVEAIQRLIDQDGFRLGQRHITLSTVGIVPAIDRLAKEGLQITLAVSLHAATDEVRNRLIPISQHYPLADLMAACRRYFQATGRRVSFEWALIAGVNDSQHQAHSLADLLDRQGESFKAHVNLIPLNPTPGYAGQPPSEQSIQSFVSVLNARGVSHTLRLRRGIEIQAGCGQLQRVAKS